LYFSYPKTQLSNVAEQELAVDEDRLAGAVAQDSMINKEGISFEKGIEYFYPIRVSAIDFLFSAS